VEIALHAVIRQWFAIRASFGNSGGDGMQQPSRFLSEIPEDLLNRWNLR
jgi:hypothetical protein